LIKAFPKLLTKFSSSKLFKKKKISWDKSVIEHQKAHRYIEKFQSLLFKYLAVAFLNMSEYEWRLWIHKFMVQITGRRHNYELNF
jgi:hypothetical protein